MTNVARAAAEAVLAARALDRTGIAIRGKDRITWLNGLVTCELAKLGAGEATYGLIVEKKGRIQTDLFVVPGRAGDRLVLAVPEVLRGAIVETLDHYLVMEDAELEPIDVAFWELRGPASERVVHAVEAPFGGTLARLGGGIVGAPTDDPAFGERLAGAVREVGGAVVDDATWDALRIERGLPRFGVEFDATLYPQEAGIEKVAVSFEKGCYLGQEVVYMLENRGHVKRKLVTLDVDGDGAVAPGADVATTEGVSVGAVKSATLGPTSGKPVAIAMVKWAQAKPGTELRVGDRAARVRAQDAV